MSRTYAYSLSMSPLSSTETSASSAFRSTGLGGLHPRPSRIKPSKGFQERGLQPGTRAVGHIRMFPVWVGVARDYKRFWLKTGDADQRNVRSHRRCPLLACTNVGQNLLQLTPCMYWVQTMALSRSLGPLQGVYRLGVACIPPVLFDSAPAAIDHLTTDCRQTETRLIYWPLRLSWSTCV